MIGNPKVTGEKLHRVVSPKAPLVIVRNDGGVRRDRRAHLDRFHPEILARSELLRWRPVGHCRTVQTMEQAKADLIKRLHDLNEAVLSKLDGLGEYDLRRPMTRTGSNLLGIVKHLASVQAGYFGDTFARPWPEPMPWLDEEAPINADMFAAVGETSSWVLNFYQTSWAHALETFAEYELDDTGTVPWWPPERRHPTLRTVLLHMGLETARHAGQIDILRELIDGAAGRYLGDQSMPGDDEIDWPAYVATVEAAAVEASAVD